jgi:SAM-dependent methyltransferase
MGSYDWLFFPFEICLNSLLKLQISDRVNLLDSFDLLDLGCGTGTFINLFKKKFDKKLKKNKVNRFKFTGIDICPEMLAKARIKNPEERFICHDIADLNSSQVQKDRFNIICSTFDTINHLENFEQWKKVFRASAKLLKNEGLLFFDINTIERMENLCLMNPVLTCVKNQSITFKITKLKKFLYNWNVCIFDNFCKNSSSGLKLIKEFNIKVTAFPFKETAVFLSTIYSEIFIFKAHEKKYLQIFKKGMTILDLSKNISDQNHIIKNGSRLFVAALVN